MATRSQVSQRQVPLDGSTAKKINNLLNSSKTRLEGLQLLDVFLPLCPDEEFLSYCVSWMQNCCKTDGATKSTSYPTHLLCKLLKTSSKYPELKKPVSFFITTRYFDFFFKYLLSSEVGWICTETCLHLYRGACGTFQEALEKHLTNEIEKNVYIPSTIARCIALLPAIGGGGNDGVNYRRNWKSQFEKFLSICHAVLNDLFADVEDFQEYAALENGPVTNGNDRNIQHLAVRFQNCCTVLGFMLLNQYPAPKTVPADLIFQLVCRGLAVSPKALSRRSQTTDLLAVRTVLPEVQCALLALLKAVIVCCKNQLLPYSHLICKLVKQSLQCTESDFPSGNEKAFARVRISTYECLCDWMAVARNGSCVDVISDVVVSSAAGDVRAKEAGVVSLKEAKPQNGSNSREKSTRRTNTTANSQLCRAALSALQFLVKFTGVLLKAEVHKFLQETVIKLLVEIQRGCFPDSPFAVPACRVEVYSLLLELVHQPCLKWPPPTNFALKLFSEGLNDTSPQVSSFCSAALNYTTIIIHPQYDNGGFPPCGGTPGDGIQGGELRWREPMEVVSEKEPEQSQPSNENLDISDKTDSSKKVSDTNDGSEISSDEDSRNTVTYSDEITERATETSRLSDSKKEDSLNEGRRADAEESDDGQRFVMEKLALQKVSSPVRESERVGGASNPPETPERKKPPPGGHPSDPKSVSPESASEGDPRKGRYYLRSKRKGSSEEPEESLKRTSSAESLKGTPAKNASKMTPSVQNSGKRPRTRASSRVEGTDGAEAKTGQDDEEDIRIAFHDSFVD